MKVLSMLLILTLALGSSFNPVSAASTTTPLKSVQPTKEKGQKNKKGNTLWRTMVHRQFKELTREHQVVALLPVEVTIEQDDLHHSPVQQLRRRAAVEARNLYSVMYAFLQRENKSHHSPLRLQDMSQTLSVLAANNIDLAQLSHLPPSQLATLLGVDAVIFCRVQRDEVLVGEASLRQNLRRIRSLAGPSAGVARVQLFDGRTDEVLWQFEGLLTLSLGKNVPQTIDSLGHIVANQLPYY